MAPKVLERTNQNAELKGAHGQVPGGGGRKGVSSFVLMFMATRNGGQCPFGPSRWVLPLFCVAVMILELALSSFIPKLFPDRLSAQTESCQERLQALCEEIACENEAAKGRAAQDFFLLF